jgi:hypothetical protein
MSRWQTFVDSLTTEGGKMFVILFFLTFLMVTVAILHFFGKDPAEQGRVLLTNAFTSLMTILLSRLGKS